VIDGLSDKMIRRHPHVFGDVAVADVAGVWANWEALKSQEATGQSRTSKLDGIPAHMGALQRGQKMQEKAAGVGFDWTNVRQITEKAGLKSCASSPTRATTRAAPGRRPARARRARRRAVHCGEPRPPAGDRPPKARCADANAKFERRFRYMEAYAVASGRQLGDMTLDELEDLWQQAKIAA